jgi:hypothetical protein
VALLAVLPNPTLAREEAAPPAGEVLERFLSRPDEPVVRYAGRWRLRAESPRFGLRAWLIAAVSLDPHDGFAYQVMEEGGSGRLRKHLRELLEKEVHAHGSGLAARSSLTPDNYEIRAGEQGEDGYRLALRPRRREERLVEGFLVVRGEDGELLRLEGRLVRRPSFWTREVQVVRDYGRVAGQRVPLRHRSRARVLVAGDATLAIDFEYDSVNGIDVSREQVAASSPAPNR